MQVGTECHNGGVQIMRDKVARGPRVLPES